MADFPAEQPAFAGTLMTERSGATAGTDTVPINCVLLCRNTGAGAHNVIIKVTASYEGLTVPDRTVALTAGQIKTINIPGDIGDANGRVGVSVDTGTIAELKYYVRWHLMAAPRSEYRATTIIWWNGVRAYNPGDPVDARAVDGPDGWVSVDDVEPSGIIPLPRPAANASQGTWAAYAVQQGHDPDEAIGMSRAALIDATKDD